MCSAFISVSIVVALATQETQPAASRPVDTEAVTQPVVYVSHYGATTPAATGFRFPKWPRDSRPTPWVRAAGADSLLFARGGSIFALSDQNLLDRDVFYRFDRPTRELREATLTEWKQAGAPRVHWPTTSIKRWSYLDQTPAIVTRRPTDFESLINDVTQGPRAHFQDRPIPTVGNVDLVVIPLPDDRVAILSARRYHLSGTYFGLEEVCEGCYFQQIFSRSSGKPAGRPVHLPLPIASGRVFGEVLPGGQEIVYFSEWLDSGCIVSLKGLGHLDEATSGSAAAIGSFCDETYATYAWTLSMNFSRRRPPDVSIRVKPSNSPQVLIEAWGSLGRGKSARHQWEYDPTAQSLRLVDQQAWDQSAPAPRSLVPSRVCGKFEIKLERGDYAGIEGPRLHFDGKPLVTRGETDLALIPIDSRRMVVVVSASRCFVRPGLFGGVEGYDVDGCYFQQAFALDGIPLSNPTHLPLSPNCGRIHAWLSPDDRHILYISEFADEICAVDLDRIASK